jgi:hypothetical protein
VKKETRLFFPRAPFKNFNQKERLAPFVTEVKTHLNLMACTKAAMPMIKDPELESAQEPCTSRTLLRHHDIF